MHMGMKMYFHFGFEDNFLFPQLNIDSSLKMWSVCGAMFLLCIIFEAIKYVRSVNCGCRVVKNQPMSENVEFNNVDTHIRSVRNCLVSEARSTKNKLSQTLLHVAQTTVGLTIMLAAMSFNVCIIFAILVGTFIFMILRDLLNYE